MQPSRRRFLRRGLWLASGAAALGAVPGLVPRPVRAAQVEWDETWDVLVVGSGFAGSAALCEAVGHGAKALMIDKMPVLGGNSAINGGAFAIVGSPQQEKRGIEDSHELYMQDLLKAGRGLNDGALVETIARNGLDAYRFTVERGVIYRDDLGHFGGHSVPRTIWPEINSGARITLPLQRWAGERGAQARKRVILDDLVLDETGSVVGVKVREGYRFHFDPMVPESENDTGTVRHYRVLGGVVMASGGFAYDVTYRQTLDPQLTPELDCTNHYGATAYSLKLLLGRSATPVDLKWIQLGPWGSPDEKGFGIAPVFAIPAFAYGIMVDVRTGRRFVNELADRRVRALAILERYRDEDGTHAYPIVFCDSRGARGTTKANVWRGIEHDVIGRFDSIGALARHYGIPEGALKETVETYNGYVREGADAAFGKPIGTLDGEKIDLSKPPFFAFRAVPKVHHCMGGVKIDTRASVIHAETEAPIPGLYAAGEAVGGPHGASRLGSCAIPDCLVFGRIAGRNAARASGARA